MAVRTVAQAVRGDGFRGSDGGHACRQHFARRLVLWHKNFTPVSYIRFLDHATTRIFLRKVGGGDSFVHGMVREYVAALRQPSAEQQKYTTHG